MGVAAERVSRILILHQVEKYIIYPGIWFTAEMVSRIFILHQEEKYIIYPGVWFTAEMVSRNVILHQEEKYSRQDWPGRSLNHAAQPWIVLLSVEC